MLRGIAVSVLVGFGLLAPFACGSNITPLVRCKLEALRVLPDDPGMVTVYDAIDVIERVKACHHVHADGGS